MRQKEIVGPERVRAIRALLLAYGIVVIKHVLTWFVLYRYAGYNYVTLNATQAATLFLGIVLVMIYRLGWRRIGLAARDLGEGAAVAAGAHVVLLGALLALRATGIEVRLFRDTYRLDALFNNWVLTGFAEELVFAGVIFGLALVALGRERRFASAWPVVILVAAMFSLWHLPGYIAVALRSGGAGWGLLGELAIPFASWLFFGSIYVLSGSLWLAAFVHASTDYALLPAITDRPLLGAIFMLTNVALAWWLGRRHRSGRQKE
jgi:membrane protease YdiL (CAAX protease family)